MNSADLAALKRMRAELDAIINRAEQANKPEKPIVTGATATKSRRLRHPGVKL